MSCFKLETDTDDVYSITGRIEYYPPKGLGFKSSRCPLLCHLQVPLLAVSKLAQYRQISS